MRFKRIQFVALLAALGLLAAACSDGDETATETGGEPDAVVATEEAEPTEEADVTEEAQPTDEAEATEEADVTEEGTDAAEAPAGDGEYIIGVSNTLVGNGWREQMICAVKAESLASGMVSEVLVANRNGGPTEQIADMQNLISQGVDAIIVNPSDRAALDPVIDAAAEQGIVVVSVDQAVTSENAYVVTNDQIAVGRIGAEWLFEQMGGSGDVLYMRGIDGVPADDDRNQGFQEALEAYPDIAVANEVFTGWDYSTAGQQALDIFGTQEVGGVWTSGTDYTVVNAMETAGHPLVPLVGQDTNEFVRQILEMNPDFVGAVTTNPAAVGGVGAAVALQVLQGEDVERETILTPEVLDFAEDAETLEGLYLPDRDATFPVQAQVEPYTSYTNDELFACQGPGEV